MLLRYFKFPFFVPTLKLNLPLRLYPYHRDHDFDKIESTPPREASREVLPQSFSFYGKLESSYPNTVFLVEISLVVWRRIKCVRSLQQRRQRQEQAHFHQNKNIERF